MKAILKLFLINSAIFIMGCNSLKMISVDSIQKQQPLFQVQVGTNHGGIVENTDLSEVDNVEVDAFSGATTAGMNVGAHVVYPLKKVQIESGLDYMLNHQTFCYNDDVNHYFGDRKILSSQFMVPVTLNLGFWRKKYKEGLLQIKFGYVFQYNLYNVSDDGDNLPEYKTNNFSNGPTFGISTTPILMDNGARLGFYADIYRGSQIYEDLYNQTSFEKPGSSFFKAGIIYLFNTK